MLKSLMLASAIAIAAPALAQTTAPATTTAKTPPASASAATGPATATPTPSATPAPAATPTPETPTNSADTVTRVVENDWAKYDVNKDGVLSKEEFGAWMVALRSNNRAENQKPEDLTAWTTAAFAQADKDKSGSLTKPELEGFLRG